MIVKFVLIRQGSHLSVNGDIYSECLIANCKLVFSYQCFCFENCYLLVIVKQNDVFLIQVK